MRKSSSSLSASTGRGARAVPDAPASEIRGRLLAATALVVVALAIPVAALLMDQGRQLVEIERRMRAVQPIDAMLAAVSSVQRERGRLAQQTAVSSSGSELVSAGRQAHFASESVDIEAAGRSLQSVDAELARKWERITEEWRLLRDRDCTNVSLGDCLGPHTQLISEMLAVVDRLAHESGVFLLQDASLRGRMEFALLRSPEQMEALGQARAIGWLLIRNPQQRYLYWRLGLAHKEAGCTEPATSGVPSSACAAIAELLSSGADGSDGAVGSDQYWEILTTAIDEKHRAIALAHHNAIITLDNEYRRSKTARIALLSAVLVMGSLAVFAAFRLWRSVAKPLGQSIETAEAILAGDVNFPVPSDIGGSLGACFPLCRKSEMYCAKRFARSSGHLSERGTMHTPWSIVATPSLSSIDAGLCSRQMPRTNAWSECR